MLRKITNHYTSKKKGSYILFKPCIAIDVSKESSHFLGYYNFNSKVTSKPKTFDHNLVGFHKVYDLYQLLLQKTKIEPLIVLEYTGIYHLPLITFFESKNLKYHLVSPLLSARHRLSNVSNVKNDKRDCFNLAEMFFENKLGIFYKRNDFYQELKDLDSEYSTNKIHLQKLEVTLNEKLAIIYPCFHSVISEFLAENTLKFLEQYPHPTILLESPMNDVITWYCENCHHSLKYSTKFINKIFNYAKSIVSGCKSNSNVVSSLLNTIKQLKVFLAIQNEVECKLISLAKKDSNFYIFTSIPGVGNNLAARLIAELGDISRFSKPEKINKYAGINPIINQSGKKDGNHLSISKMRNKQLRTILFNIVRSMIKKKSKPSALKAYYYNKKAQPRVLPKVALIATVNKLIRLIFSLCKNGQCFDPTQL